MRFGTWLVLLMSLAIAGTARAGTPTTAPPPVADTGCEEHEVWADGDAGAVAAALPSKYTVATDGASGKPLIFARAERCGALVLADYGVVIESPDGYGCASGLPEIGAVVGNMPPMCDWYTLSFVSNQEQFVDLLREATPSVPARYVPGLTYETGAPDAQGRTPFHFAVGAPSPSAYTIDDVSSLRPGTISLRGSYYFPDTPQGTVKLLVSTDDLTTGHADTTLRAAAGSELARLMGATERPSAEPYNEFGVIRIGHGVLRKQLVGPALPGEQLDSFAGSCSLKGDVTFDPPAKNSPQQPTTYAYDATGTCSGVVDGTAVSDAPVAMKQSGRADASCTQALAFPPGNGELSLPGGVHLPYTVDFTAKLTENDGALYGTRSGLASLHSTFATQRTSPTVIADCGGPGAKTAPMDLTFTTRSPLVSVRPESSTTRVVQRRRRRHHARHRGHHRKHHHRRHHRHH